MLRMGSRGLWHDSYRSRIVQAISIYGRQTPVGTSVRNDGTPRSAGLGLTREHVRPH